MHTAGLRVDVDTLRGTRLGLPALRRMLAGHGIKASFFFSVGPDNMGRHLWRLLRPTFLWKMLRSGAPSLYGWDILLRGTLWPGPEIGRRLAAPIRAIAEDGHEIGFHAWDHHGWQMRIAAMTPEQVREITRRGVESLTRITGRAPVCAAVPGWRCTDTALLAQSEFGFAYQSDCRGDAVFRPQVADRTLKSPQVPVTLPTYDEMVGRDGVTDTNYNERLLARFVPGRLNVLTIHAEVEGVARTALFADFLTRARAAGWQFVPLGELARAHPEPPLDRVVAGSVPGREGWVAVQAGAAERRS